MDGIRFCPDHHECIVLLMSKVAGFPLPCGGGVIEDYKNPYDEENLADMFMEAQEKDLYFFTKLTNKGKSGLKLKNANRIVGKKGTWHGEQNKDVMYGDDGKIGTYHTFLYREVGSENDCGYIMTEYHLLKDRCLEYDPLKNEVFCVLRVNRHGKKDSRKMKRKLSNVSFEEAAAAKQPRMLDSIHTSIGGGMIPEEDHAGGYFY